MAHPEKRGRTESDNVQPEAADTVQNQVGSRVMGLIRYFAKLLSIDQ